MSISKRFFACLTAVATIAAGVGSAQAAFTDFIIRNGVNPPTIQPNNVYVPGATEFVISQTGQKAAWGSNDINGATIGQISNLGITRYDDPTRFTAGSGAAVAPYFNIWVTDGAGKYAVLANEPSDGAFQPLFVGPPNGPKSYSLSYADLASHPVKVYETPNGGGNSTTTWVHNLFGNVPLTFADVASLVIEAPSPAYIANGANNVGTGAPRQLSDYEAWGFNWVFGDTLSNYVAGMEGFVVGSPVAQAIPEPASLGLAGIAVIGMIAARRRQRLA